MGINTITGKKFKTFHGWHKKADLQLVQKQELPAGLYIDLLISKLVHVYWDEYPKDKRIRPSLRGWVKKACGGTVWLTWQKMRDEYSQEDFRQQLYLIFANYPDVTNKSYIWLTTNYMKWLTDNTEKRWLGEEGYADNSAAPITEYQSSSDTIPLTPNNYIAFLATRGYSVREIEEVMLYAKSEVHRQLQAITNEGISIRNNG